MDPRHWVLSQQANQQASKSWSNSALLSLAKGQKYQGWCPFPVSYKSTKIQLFHHHQLKIRVSQQHQLQHQYPWSFKSVLLIRTSLNIGKDTTDPRVEFCYHNFFTTHHKFCQKSWSNFIFRISTKHLLQNLNQTSPSWQNLKFKILTKPSLNFISSAKYWPNSSLEILQH